MPPKKSVRAAPPAHYTLKIECFSSLEEKPGEMIRYASDMFEVGGYKWQLFLYPKGHTEQGGEGYLSLYLAIVETQTYAAGWEVSVNSKMFLFNHSDDKFLTVEDDKDWRFHKSKTEWGIPHLISLDELHDASRGFLSGDSFICGIEIYPVKHNGKGENVSLVKDPQGGTYKWQISNLSAIDQESILSDKFDVGDNKWQLQLYPKGDSSSNGENLSLYLNLLDEANCLPREKKIYAKFTLRIKGQNGAKNHWKQVTQWFSSSATSGGHTNFISITDLHDSSKGLLVNDSIFTEVQILATSRSDDEGVIKL